MGVEAAVGPHGQWSGGAGVPHSVDGLAQEVGGAAGPPEADWPSLSRPCRQHVAGPSSDGEERMIAPLAGVSVLARARLAQTVGLVRLRRMESRSMVNGSLPGPAPGPQARASACRLTRSNCRAWPRRKLRRNVPSVDGAFTVQPSTRSVPPARSTSASSMSATGGPPASADAHQRQQLVARIRPTGCISQVDMALHQLAQSQVVGQGDGQKQPRAGYQALIIKGNADPARWRVTRWDGEAALRVVRPADPSWAPGVHGVRHRLRRVDDGDRVGADVC